MLSLVLMHEMAPFSIVADAYYVEIAAELRFVLGVAAEVSEFVVAVSKLTFISVFTGAALLERPAQLGLVAAGVDGGGGGHDSEGDKGIAADCTTLYRSHI